MKIRLKFKKYGSMIFIGHLDILRYFQKAMRRANIDIAYSEGFSPHQVMSFAAPLGVGIYSNGDYFDIEAHSTGTSEEMLAAINEQMAEGIEVIEARMLPDNATNAMASVAASRYTIRFREGHEPEFDYKAGLAGFYAQETITIIKKTKKGEAELNLKQFIYELHLDENGNIGMLVDSSSSGNIKPGLVMEAFYAAHGKTPGEFDFIVTREDTYGNIGTAEHPVFVPLGAVGVEF